MKKIVLLFFVLLFGVNFLVFSNLNKAVNKPYKEKIYEKNLENYDSFLSYDTSYKYKDISNLNLYFGVLYYRLYTKTNEDIFKFLSKKLLEKAKEGRGASEAFLELGYLAEEEENNIKKAEMLLKKSASLGNDGASFLLSEYGFHYLIGKSSHMATTVYNINGFVEKENEKLLRWLEVSGELQGNAFASYNYGWYLVNNGEIDRGIKNLEFASEKGNAFASMILGDIYYNGEKVNQDFERALNYYLLSSRQRNPIASYKAAMMLKVGFGGVEQNKKVYNDLIVLSADKKYPPALYEKAMILYNDKNIDKSQEQEIISLLELSSSRGYTDAAKQLADFYTWGIFVEKNHKRSVALYSIAANAYDWDAVYKFSVLLEHGTLFAEEDLPKDYREKLENMAYKYQVVGSNLGIPYSQFELATKFYENDEWEKASYMAEKSAMQGVGDAKRLLAFLPETKFLYNVYLDMKERGFSDEEMAEAINSIMLELMVPKK